MSDDSPCSTHSISPGKARALRARSVPSARPFRVAVFFFAMHYLGMVGSVTALVYFFFNPTQTVTWFLLGGMVFSIFMWLLAFFKRRSTHCPLCKGTPLINTGARTHARAWRIFPCNHGVSAMLSILATQRFRCMYCGSDFDLLKPPTRLLQGWNEDRPQNQDKRS